jgi:hypothetical protein
MSSSSIGHIPIIPFYGGKRLNCVFGSDKDSTYLLTHAAITGVVGLRGHFDGEFESPAMAIAIIGLGLWKWSLHCCVN